MGRLQIIGAGLPRTGTVSQKIALETLGLGPCYHMVEVLQNLDLTPIWADAKDGKADWDEVFAGFKSTVDWPGSYFYKELVTAYPEAKVILSVRDADAWALSIKSTMWDLFFGDTLMHDMSTARSRIDPMWAKFLELTKSMWQEAGFFTEDEIDLEDGTLAKAMVRYNEEVIATVPADRLLVWSAKEGWEPLCAFLGVPVPSEPFPHANETAGFATMLIGGSLAKLNEWQASQTTSLAH